MKTPLNILVTLGPTQEPIDAVRYIGNRSSGRMGAAVVSAACDAGHRVTAIAGPVNVPLDSRADIDRVTTAQEMFDAVVAEFPSHDLLVMLAAVADYRPKTTVEGKLARGKGPLSLELEPTPDIVAYVAHHKRPEQRTIAFSLEADDDVARAQDKMRYKSVDLMVHNPLNTMNAAAIRATILWPTGQTESVDAMSKEAFARVLIERIGGLWPSMAAD